MIVYRLKKKADDFESNPDKEFMEECAKVDHEHPLTWNKYTNWEDILDMEVAEFKKTHNVKELYHIAVVCLKIWRHHKHYE